MFKAIKKELIDEVGTTPILKERLLLLDDVLSKAKRKNRRLVKKIAKLEHKLEDLRKELRQRPGDPEFVEYLGVKFKRRASGGYDRVPYCANCLIAMSSGFDDFVFSCSVCKFKTSFTGHKLDSILQEVELEFREYTFIPTLPVIY